MTNPEPHLLIFETSGRTGLVAIAQGSRILGARRLEEARRHARDLAPAVAALLAEVGWGARDLAGVIVSRGPGSYTGLRVGIMSAKTFAYATGCALIAVDTFAAIARQVPAEALSVDVLADAQQDKIYVQRYSRPDSAAPLIATAPLNIQRIADWLVDPQPAAWITGPGPRVLGERRPAGCQVVAAELWDPQPESLVEIGLARYQTGERDDFWSVEPLYLRPSAAEEKWQERGTPRRPEAGG